MASDHTIFDRDLLHRRRERAAPDAARHDFLLQRVADDFAERLSIVRREFAVAANIGAHHGVLTERLMSLPSIGSMIETDTVGAVFPSPEGRGVLFVMSAGKTRTRIIADEEALPFAPASLDLVVSGLVLHHVNDLPGTLIQVRRALKPDGLFLAALLGGETLKELREAWLIAEDEVSGGASPRVAPFADVRDLGGLLQRAGFALPVADSDVVRVTYASPLDLMREIKAFGASNVLSARRRVPVTRKLLFRAAEIYAERFALADGRVSATFEIITLTAWVPHESQQKPLQPGSAKTRLADALGVTEQGAGEKAGGER
jgi:NADH dehydrogenase [ubiquinone] 1 alpha subcomplex assembly factor 5